MYQPLLALLVLLTFLLGLAFVGVSLLGIQAIVRGRFVRNQGRRSEVLVGPEAVKAGLVLILLGLASATPWLIFGTMGLAKLIHGGL
jgi:hypothetical protein